MGFPPRDFKSLASATFAIPANTTSLPNDKGSDLPAAPSVARLTRAGNGTRTRDPNLGKVVLYQLSYSRVDLEYKSGLVARLVCRLRPFSSLDSDWG